MTTQSPVKRKKINYWRAFDGLLGFTKVDNITKYEYERPMPTINFYIPKLMPANFTDEVLTIPDETSKRLEFEFKERLETGLIYRFRGWK